MVEPKTIEIPLSKSKHNIKENTSEPKSPPSKDYKWRNPPWKMKGPHRNPTKENDRGNPPLSSKPIEQFLHEAEDSNYINITPSSHP